DARTSKQLATARRDLDVGLDLDAEAAREPDRSRLREFFRRYELRDPLRRLEEAFGERELAAASSPPAPGGVLRARTRAGSPADITGFGSRRALCVVARPAQVPEGALFAEDMPWRFAVAPASPGAGARADAFRSRKRAQAASQRPKRGAA